MSSEIYRYSDNLELLFEEHPTLSDEQPVANSCGHFLSAPEEADFEILPSGE